MEDSRSAQQILDNIFDVMQRLYDEMRLNKNGAGEHLRIFEIFAELGRTLVGADRASFWKWDKRHGKLLTATATGLDQIIIDDTTGIVGRALAENRTIVTNDPYSHPDFNAEVDKKTGYVTKSILVMPVANCRGEIIGAFQVINKLGDEAKFDAEKDTKRLSIAAFICGMALESDLFLADSQHDKLTELKNRLSFHSDYQLYQRRAAENALPVSLIMCDIDFFKKVNDTYGHNAGDAILMHVAKILKRNLRSCDSAYRWGGEEFILVLEGTALAGAAKVAERIRLAVADSVCQFNGDDLRVTMSFGCAEISFALAAEDNVKLADSRLYTAKKTGRNKVVAE
ncbi:MAG: sensor domain-containing diguanylate cyclase [Selenomonadaceae bacterium]|nr:sensor domain-containing diguanylate cyclase [Selenomonadaceae bacterium]